MDGLHRNKCQDFLKTNLAKAYKPNLKKGKENFTESFLYAPNII